VFKKDRYALIELEPCAQLQQGHQVGRLPIRSKERRLRVPMKERTGIMSQSCDELPDERDLFATNTLASP
jgi:hypothetical protein